MKSEVCVIMTMYEWLRVAKMSPAAGGLFCFFIVLVYALHVYACYVCIGCEATLYVVKVCAQ